MGVGAEVAEQADALRSGRSAPCGRVSSNLTFGTRKRAPVAQWIERYPAEVEVRGSNPLWRTSTSILKYHRETPSSLRLAR